MSQPFDPLNLLILGIAVVLLFKLRSVLGTRTGNERRYDPVQRDQRETELRREDNVIHMPGREPARSDGDGPAEEGAPIWQGYAEPGSPIAGGLEKIAGADPGFSPRSFLEGARIAYEMIVSAFAEGDKKALKPLLSREVYDGFSTAIDTRQRNGETLESKFVGIDNAQIVGAELAGKKASLTVRFIADLIAATRSRAGEVIDGDATRVRQITDVWTFERDISSRDPNWRLISTEGVA
ncbi:MAG: Tim44/TimA family putative adaptor protein [Aestuariivirgaceae bacterium]|jgi:predicted lipid-binding transport protein (Tim44 family)